MNNRNIVQSDFSKNVLTLISGTTVAQFISIAISPLLSRMYSPEEFGLFGTFFSVIGLICLFASARYDGAILLPKDDKIAANLFVLSLLINIVTAFIVGILVFVIFLFFPVSQSSNSELIKWFYLAPIFVFFIGISQSIISWNNRNKYYVNIANYRITNSVGNNLSSLFLGFFKFPLINGLLTSYLFGSIISVVVFFRKLKLDYYQFKGNVSKEQIIIVAKLYKQFPIVNSFQALSDAFQINGIIYFVSYFFAKNIVGVYSFAMRILMVPMNFAGAAVAQVFYQSATQIYNVQGDLSRLIRTTILKSLLFVLPILIILVFWGPQIFSFVFGSEWIIAGEYARILAPWILLDFIRAPLSQLAIILGKQKKLLIFSVFSNVIVLSTMLYCGIVLKNIKTGFVLLSFFQSVYNIFIILWFIKIGKNKK